MDNERRLQVFEVCCYFSSLPCRIVGDADIQSFSLTDHQIQCLRSLFEWCFGIRAVRIKNIHIIKSHPFQALIKARRQILFGSPFPVWSGPHIIAGLAGNDQFIPVRQEVFFQNLAECFLRTAWRRTVVVRQIEMGDPKIEGALDHFARIVEQIHLAEVMPKPKGNGRQFQTAVAYAVIDHFVVSVLCWLIHVITSTS
ncbi:hypothetical protein SDC9_147133 [bioreactor metagenome]|uniref:Uncharacterized protein n=1 Tax=bioreactor metagenome TaxID=1076179 RepID=A0A645EFP7_9ZZZZ